MTLVSSINKWTNLGNGTTAIYSYTAKIFAQTDLVLTVKDSDGAETTLTITTDYTVTGVGSIDGGTIVLVDDGQDWIDTNSFLETGWTLVIRRVRGLVQNTDIRNGGAFYRESVEDEFDKQIMIDQQQQEEIDRSIKIAVTSSATPVLPEPVDGYVNQWDGTDGDMIAVPYSGDTLTDAVTDAETAQTAAELAETNAETAQGLAEGFKDDAETAASSFDVDDVTLEKTTDFHIKDGGVGATQLVTDAVETLKIKDANVTSAKLEADLAFGTFPTTPESAPDADYEVANKKYVDDSGLSSYRGTFTRDISTVTGTQAVTGIGFQPTTLIIMGALANSGGQTFSIGLAVGTSDGLIFSLDGDITKIISVDNRFLDFIISDGTYNYAVVNSMDSDGFTLGWTKAGAPTGSVVCHFIALK